MAKQDFPRAAYRAALLDSEPTRDAILPKYMVAVEAYGKFIARCVLGFESKLKRLLTDGTILVGVTVPVDDSEAARYAISAHQAFYGLSIL